MSRYIDADALKENCYKKMDELMESTSEHLSAEASSLLCGFTLIDYAPSIDIVRCKECKYWDTHTMQFAENNLIIARCKQWLQYSRMNGYCHNGEHKESE